MSEQTPPYVIMKVDYQQSFGILAVFYEDAVEVLALRRLLPAGG